jgi:hypothetical protein
MAAQVAALPCIIIDLPNLTMIHATHYAAELDGICGNSERKRFSDVDRRITYEVWLHLTKLNVQVK